MAKTLICMNVFLKNSYHSHNLSKFSYKSMLNFFLKLINLEHTFHIKIPHNL